MSKARKVSPLNYAFAVGKIRSLERFLISNEAFQEAIESETAEALRLFAESDLYSEEILHIKDSQQLEGALSLELLKLRKTISDLILDKGLLNIVAEDTIKCVEDVIKNYPSVFLRDYFMHMIDMHNIKTFLRLYILKEPLEKLEAALNCEGFVKIGVFLRLYTADLTAFLNQMEYVHRREEVIDYSYFLKDAIEKAQKEKSFVALERAINDFLIGVLKQAKYLSFGPEPVLAYYFAKVNEINLIRMIIMAKFNNVPQDLIMERLNTVYA